MSDAKRKICIQCGAVSKPEETIKGSIWIEVVLWLSFLLPGVIYSIWRMTTKAKVCAVCGSSAIIPLSSPEGRIQYQKYQQIRAAKLMPKDIAKPNEEQQANA
jgi:hypothetical protein